MTFDKIAVTDMTLAIAGFGKSVIGTLFNIREQYETTMPIMVNFVKKIYKNYTTQQVEVSSKDEGKKNSIVDFIQVYNDKQV